MHALKAIRQKRDTRNYTLEPVPDDVLDRLLEAARMAGSAKNGQPVRLIVVTDHDDRVALKESGDFATWIDQAPICVVFTVRTDAGPRRQFDVGRHAQNLMIAAEAEGLASCPVTIHRPEVAAALLNVPDGVEPSMIVTLGLPAEATGPSPIAGPRIDMDDYVRRGRWA